MSPRCGPPEVSPRAGSDASSRRCPEAKVGRVPLAEGQRSDSGIVSEDGGTVPPPVSLSPQEHAAS